jgi:hypothetical protein
MMILQISGLLDQFTQYSSIIVSVMLLVYLLYSYRYLSQHLFETRQEQERLRYRLADTESENKIKIAFEEEEIELTSEEYRNLKSILEKLQQANEPDEGPESTDSSKNE